MALNFPNSPTNGQIYENYIYNATVGTWQLVSIDNIYTGAVIDTTPPGSPVAGDMWWDSDDGKLFIYYNDGTSSQWVNASGPSVAVQDTAPAGYEGQLWLDSTDGSMYVYYTDPGGANAQWIGAVSNNNTAGNIIQVVSTTKTDTFSASVTTGAFTPNITGLEATITPRSTSSKILVQVSVDGAISLNFGIVAVQLQRDGSPLGIADAEGVRSQMTAQWVSNVNASSDIGNANKTFLDSPGTTASVTYGVKLQNQSSGTATVHVNRSDADLDLVRKGRSISTITLMEIAG